MSGPFWRDWRRSADLSAAALLGVGAVVQVPRGRGTGVFASGLLLALIVVATVGLRRRRPLGAAAVALGGMAAYQLVTSDSQMTFEPFAILLAFYSVGRVWRARSKRVVALLTLLGLGSMGVCFAHQDQATVVNIVSSWLLFVVLPELGGATITKRAMAASELQALTQQLVAEQALVAAAKAADERNRVARELHDVITHCVSVMVIQINAAMILLGRDAAAARSALHHVIASGHDALVDLRRITGTWSRSDADASTHQGLHQLDDLAANAKRAGLAVWTWTDGSPRWLPPDVNHAAYRLVQEALTNALKHAPRSVVAVSVEYGASVLAIRIRNDGSAANGSDDNASRGGRGLLGMRERIDALGGRLDAGPDGAGGWMVDAAIPYVADAANFEPPPLTLSERTRHWLLRPVRFDVACCLLWLTVLEAEALTSSQIAGPRWFNGVVAACSAGATLLRRRWPLRCFSLIAACSLALQPGLGSGQHATVNGVFGVVVAPYVVACWATPRKARTALLLWAVLAEVAVGLSGATVATAIGPLVAATVAFTAGTVARSQRLLATSLRDTARNLRAERHDREQLAIVSERSRLTRALQLVVAEGVDAMVVQAHVAVTLLDGGPEDVAQCTAAMSAVETTGRDVLAQLRHILGVLRHSGSAADVAPQPGVDRIHELVDKVRTSGRRVELSIEGDPGTLAAGIDVATYRILEDALLTGPRSAAPAIAVCLRFTPADVEVRVSDPACAFASWSAPTLQHRVAMFRGAMAVTRVGIGGTEVSVRLPRLTEQVCA